MNTLSIRLLGVAAFIALGSFCNSENNRVKQFIPNLNNSDPVVKVIQLTNALREHEKDKEALNLLTEETVKSFPPYFEHLEQLAQKISTENIDMLMKILINTKHLEHYFSDHQLVNYQQKLNKVLLIATFSTISELDDYFKKNKSFGILGDYLSMVVNNYSADSYTVVDQSTSFINNKVKVIYTENPTEFKALNKSYDATDTIGKKVLLADNLFIGDEGYKFFTTLEKIHNPKPSGTVSPIDKEAARNKFLIPDVDLHNIPDNLAYDVKKRLKLLASYGGEDRIKACEQIRQYNDYIAVPYLVKVLRGETSVKVMNEVILTLGYIGDAKVIGIIKEKMNENSDLANMGRQALAMITDRINQGKGAIQN